MPDADKDGLQDMYEEEIGTDVHNLDTDGDGLNDGYEELCVMSNPLATSTLNDGVPDSELDIDQDGLTMIEEYQYNRTSM